MRGGYMVVVRGFAAMRLTRLVVADKITEPWRGRLYDWAWDDENPVERDGEQWPSPRAGWRTWVHQALTCAWCFGVYVSTAVYCAWRWGGSIAHAIITVAAVAAVQGAVATWTSGDDDK